MNAVILSNDGTPVTTSFAIAEGTNNNHKSVIDLVRAYISDLAEFGRVAFETEPFETAGGMQHREIAFLNEQQATLLITYMRNSEIVRTFKKRLVKDFWAMRAPAAPAIPKNLSAALRLAADQADQIEAQQAQLAIVSPKAEALDLIANADGMLNLQAAGKTLQQQPNKFIAWLRENGWIYKRPGSVSNSARAEKFNAGYLATKSHVVVLPDGSERVRDQVMVTPKGLAKLAGVFSVGVAKNA